MTRFQKLSLATVITTILLVTVGVIVRATDSGMGCPDWPLCHGQLIPPVDDYKAWLEWIHRAIAVVIGFMILGVAFLAWKDHRHQRSILIPSIAAVLLVGFQAWLGRETVRLNNSGESVTARLRGGDGAARPAHLRHRPRLLSGEDRGPGRGASGSRSSLRSRPSRRTRSSCSGRTSPRRMRRSCSPTGRS